MNKTHHSRITFGSWGAVKVHAGMVGSTFARKHTRSGPLLAVEMSKKCTLLWREAHLEVRMLKLPHVWASDGRADVVQASKKCTPLWREAHVQVKSFLRLVVLSQFRRSDVVLLSDR